MIKYLNKSKVIIILSDIKTGGGAELQVKKLHDLLNKNNNKSNIELFLLSNKYKFTNKFFKLIFISFSISYLLFKIIIKKYIRGNEIYLITFTIIPNILGRFLKKAKLINKLITSIRNQTFASKQVNKILKNTFLMDDYTIYNSKESLKKCIQQKFSRKINSFVVYNLKDESNFQEEEIFNKNDSLSFGYVGRFEPQKGIDNLIKAIKLIEISKNKKVEFNFYGKGSLLNYLISEQKIINSKSTNIKMKIHGWNNSPFEQKFNYLIIPSKWEGFPNVLIEGIQTKKIIIANSVGGIKDFADFYSTKFIKPLKSPNELSNLIMDCIKLSKLQKSEIIKNQDKALKNFYLDNEVKCWQEFI